MSLRELQKRRRQDLLWYVLGFVVVQLGLGVAIDRYWPAVRDPAFHVLERIVRERHEQAPTSPLVLAMGSSRTKMALRAESLNSPGDAGSPVVVNCGVDAAGPMMDVVVLRRWMKDGIRPDLVFMEIVPMALSVRRGAPFEERNLPSCRFTLAEMARLWTYYSEPYRLIFPWGRGRVLPCDIHQAELRDSLGLDAPTAGRPRYGDGRDGYGWFRPNKVSAQEVDRKTRENLEWYDSALSQPAVAPGALQAFRDAVKFCRHRNIAVVFIVPPEASACRAYKPEIGQSHMDAVRNLARELDVPLIDARTWVDDDGFSDGHHATEKGADQFTRRFARDALQPFLPRGPICKSTPVD